MTLNYQAEAECTPWAATRWGRRGLASVAAAALATVAQFWSGAAHAQRGEAYALNEELAVRPSPDRGFPGMFDTELVRPGAFVTNLPMASVYYGVTRDLSVGTILWSYLPLTRGQPGGSLHARYCLGSTSWFRSTADVLVLGVKAKMDGGDGYSPILAGALGSNTDFALDRWNRLTATAWLARVGVQDLDGMDVGGTAVVLGGTYSLTFARWGALHLTGLYLASGTADVGTFGVGGVADLAGALRPVDRLLARGTVSLRTGSWLFNLGAAKLGPSMMPWVNVAFEVGG
jgi:hypothetical protein